MSFWFVPRSFDHGPPASSAMARYIAQIGAAGLLIVIDVLIAPTSIPRKRTRMSSRLDTATPHGPHPPLPPAPSRWAPGPAPATPHGPNPPFASASSVSYP